MAEARATGSHSRTRQTALHKSPAPEQTNISWKQAAPPGHPSVQHPSAMVFADYEQRSR